MCETLLLQCKKCNTVIKTFKTSNVINSSENKKSKMTDINLRSVVAATSAGGGLTSLRRICTDFNFPEPVTERAYNNYLHHIEEKSIANCERSMAEAAKKLRKIILKDEIDDGRIINVAVSVDGGCMAKTLRTQFTEWYGFRYFH